MEDIHAIRNKYILVPVDYTDKSIQACRYAAKIALKTNLNIVIFHAYYSAAFELAEISGGLQGQHEIHAEYSDYLLTSENKHVNEFADNLYQFDEFKKLNKKRVLCEVRLGIAKEAIRNFGDEVQPALVLMGTRKAEAKSMSFLGSTSESVINNLDVPVLIIPEDYNFIGSDEIKKILYLTDYDESDFESVRKLSSFAKIFDASIHCAHIGDKHGYWEQLKLDGFKEYFHRFYPNIQIECHALSSGGNVISSLDKYILEREINIISLTERKRSIINKLLKPSFAKKVFLYTNIPLLAFHS